MTVFSHDFLAPNKKPAEAGFSKTIPTPCRLPPRQWSIILDPGELLFTS
ncbi:hypothetical protein K0038_05058 [Pseudomonas syringae]|nr:hypothetical protein [Pseudomonas syringae]